MKAQKQYFYSLEAEEQRLDKKYGLAYFEKSGDVVANSEHLAFAAYDNFLEYQSMEAVSDLAFGLELCRESFDYVLAESIFSSLIAQHEYATMRDDLTKQIAETRKKYRSASVYLRRLERLARTQKRDERQMRALESARLRASLARTTLRSAQYELRQLVQRLHECEKMIARELKKHEKTWLMHVETGSVDTIARWRKTCKEAKERVKDAHLIAVVYTADGWIEKRS